MVEGGGGLVGCVQSRKLCAPRLPTFILLVSFSDTSLEDLILDLSMIAFEAVFVVQKGLSSS